MIHMLLWRFTVKLPLLHCEPWNHKPFDSKLLLNTFYPTLITDLLLWSWFFFGWRRDTSGRLFEYSNWLTHYSRANQGVWKSIWRFKPQHNYRLQASAHTTLSVNLWFWLAAVVTSPKWKPRGILEMLLQLLITCDLEKQNSSRYETSVVH